MITFISPGTQITGYPVRVLSSYIKSKGFQARCVFLPNLEYEYCQLQPNREPLYSDAVINQLTELCRDSSLIGISLFTTDFKNAVYLTRRLKEKLDIPIIWGGKHPSAKPDECLKYADMVCIGEGEEALTELLGKIEKGQDYYNTLNIWFKQNGSIIKNPLRPLNEDLDSIPFADYSFNEHYIWQMEEDKINRLTPEIYEKYNVPELTTGLIPYRTLFSRGCHYACTYCFSFREMYKGQRYLRFRSIENIMKELEWAKMQFPYAKLIWFCDDNIIGLPMEEIREFCRQYKQRIGLSMAFSGHPVNINEEKLACFIDAGLIRIHVGIQTGSRRTQMLYKRITPDETVIDAIKALDKFKKSLCCSFDIIIDNPYETNDDLTDTIKLLLKFPKPRRISMFSLTFFPGTELFEKAKKDGILSEKEEFSAYGKHTLSLYYRKKRYLNFVFALLTRNIPDFLIKTLINKQVVVLLDRPFINEVLFNAGVLVKKIKRKRRI